MNEGPNHGEEHRAVNSTVNSSLSPSLSTPYFNTLKSVIHRAWCSVGIVSAREVQLVKRSIEKLRPNP